MANDESPTGIINLLKRVGEKNVKVQMLDQVMTGAYAISKKKGGGTSVSFVTEEITTTEVVTGQSSMFGMIVWVPRHIAAKVQQEWKDEATSSGDSGRSGVRKKHSSSAV